MKDGTNSLNNLLRLFLTDNEASFMFCCYNFIFLLFRVVPPELENCHTKLINLHTDSNRCDLFSSS